MGDRSHEILRQCAGMLAALGSPMRNELLRCRPVPWARCPRAGTLARRGKTKAAPLESLGPGSALGSNEHQGRALEVRLGPQTTYALGR